MSLYFLDLFEGDECLDDVEGFEAESVEHIIVRAIEAARDIMAEEIRFGRLCLSWRIEILDDARQPIIVVPFRDALEISGDPDR